MTFKLRVEVTRDESMLQREGGKIESSIGGVVHGVDPVSPAVHMMPRSETETALRNFSSLFAHMSKTPPVLLDDRLRAR